MPCVCECVCVIYLIILSLTLQVCVCSDGGENPSGGIRLDTRRLCVGNIIQIID